MKTRFLVPVVALFFAIGMTFALDSNPNDPNQDYVLIDGQFMPLGTELDCTPGDTSCKVRLQNGEIYEVYDAPDPDSKKPGDGTIYDL